MKKYSRLDEVDKADIIRAYYEQRCSRLPDIAISLGVSERGFLRVLKEAGINTKRKNRYRLDEAYFNKIDTPLKGYLLGLLAADGCVTEHNYIALQMIDKEAVGLVKESIGYDGDLRELDVETNFGKSKAYRINFSSKEMASALRSYGISANTQIKMPPENEYVSDFYLGYFDGDGCVFCNAGRSGGQINIVASKELCECLRLFFDAGSLVEHESGMWYWKIYAREHFQRFADMVYGHNLGLPRKKAKIAELLDGYKNEDSWTVKSWSEKGL